MNDWRTRAETWLAQERMDEAETADRAFVHVFRALPAIAPAEDFVHRAVAAAWQARRRPQSAWIVGTFAASLLFALVTGGAMYAVFGLSGIGWLLTTTAKTTIGLLSSGIMTASAAAAWWITTANLGRTFVGFLALPQAVATVIGIVLLGIAALSAMRRALDTALEIR